MGAHDFTAYGTSGAAGQIEHPAKSRISQEPGWALCLSENISLSDAYLTPVLKRAGFQVQLVAADHRPLDLSDKPYGFIIIDLDAPNGPGLRSCQIRARYPTYRF